MAVVITQQIVNVQISNNLTSFMSEKRFEKGITIADLKVCFQLYFCSLTSKLFQTKTVKVLTEYLHSRFLQSSFTCIIYCLGSNIRDEN